MDVKISAFCLVLVEITHLFHCNEEHLVIFRLAFHFELSVIKKPKFHPNPNLKLMDQDREVLRYHHYAYRTA